MLMCNICLVNCRLLSPDGNGPTPCSARRVFASIAESQRRSHERTSMQPKAHATVLGQVQRAIEDASTAWGNPTPTIGHPKLMHKKEAKKQYSDTAGHHAAYRRAPSICNSAFHRSWQGWIDHNNTSPLFFYF